MNYHYIIIDQRKKIFNKQVFIIIKRYKTFIMWKMLKLNGFIIIRLIKIVKMLNL